MTEQERGPSTMSNPRIYERTPGWPKPEPGTPCAECGAALHGFPCIHHNDSCSYFKEGDLWAESEAVSTMSNLDPRDLLLEFGQWLADNPVMLSGMTEAFEMDEPDEYAATVDAFLFTLTGEGAPR